MNRKNHIGLIRAVGLTIGCLSLFTTCRADDWPQWLGPQRDGVWREEGILSKFPAAGLKARWRVPIGGGYAGPAVAGGRVYVTDRQLAKKEPAAPAKKGAGTERVLCFNAADGHLIWKHEYDCPYAKISYDSGPRTTPVIHQGRVYTLGAMGDLLCLDALSGSPFWSRSFPKEYKAKPPVWGWSSNLLVDGDKVIALVGGEGSTVVAFHKDTGKEMWRALSTKEIGYAPPMIYEAGGRRQLIIWDGDTVHALDPRNGKAYWHATHPADGNVRRPSVNIATPRMLGDLLFISTTYHGSLALKLASDKPAASVLWRGKSNNPEKPDGLHALMTTPASKDGYIYGVGAGGDLVCIDPRDGKRLWETYAATTGKRDFCGTAFLVRHQDRFFIFSETGDLLIARLTPRGYEEVDRAHVLEPTQTVRGRLVVWSHPAFADKCVFARNDKELVCVPLGE